MPDLGGSREVQLLLGAVLSLGVGAAARAAKSLTKDGAVAAVLVGTLVFGFGGWPAAVLLVTFFGTSSLLTHWQAGRKSHPEHRRGRSAGQVLANGLVATTLAVWAGLAASSAVLTGFVGALAAATADTWATEVGMVSAARPRLITTFRPVAPGTSGGVTFLGTAAGLAGATLIGLLASRLLHTPIAAPIAAGTVGMLVDSLLGATVERRAGWITNDAVNLAMTATGALVAIVLGGQAS